MDFLGDLVSKYGPWAIFCVLFVWMFLKNGKDTESMKADWQADKERLYKIVENNTAAITSLKDHQKEGNDLLKRILFKDPNL